MMMSGSADDDNFVHELLAYLEHLPESPLDAAHPLPLAEPLSSSSSSGGTGLHGPLVEAPLPPSFPSPSELATTDSSGSETPSVRHRGRARTPSSSSKRSAHNASRERMQRELRHLRVESAELARSLAALLEKREHARQRACDAAAPKAAAAQSQLMMLTAWERIAERQLAHRRRAELENEVLKARLKRSQQVAATLQQTMRDWNREFGPSAAERGQPHVSLKSMAFGEYSEIPTYEQLATELDAAALRIDEVFAANGLAQWRVGAVLPPVQIKSRVHPAAGDTRARASSCYTEFLDAEVFPFRRDEVARASWRVWKHRSISKKCLVYERMPHKTHSVASLSCCQIRLSGADVALKHLSVTRVFRYADRFVYAWRGVTKSDDFPGAVVDEFGWQVVRNIDDADDSGAVILTCTQLEPRGTAEHVAGLSASMLVRDLAPLANLALSAFKDDMQEMSDQMMDVLLTEPPVSVASPDSTDATAYELAHSRP
ncbi:hypothetical protein PybrP1_011914 [[Pythium] brassicae (nom. inval.)]|nr:hypothetical protein PybrP1_011914 [[Pythium] brassicae (nom. inval.)]